MIKWMKLDSASVTHATYWGKHPQIGFEGIQNKERDDIWLIGYVDGKCHDLGTHKNERSMKQAAKVFASDVNGSYVI